MASEQDPESLGAYVISQGQTASDVLAVMLLQKQFGMTKNNGKLMRVVPLFETLNDLNNSPKQLESCEYMIHCLVISRDISRHLNNTCLLCHLSIQHFTVHGKYQREARDHGWIQ